MNETITPPKPDPRFPRVRVEVPVIPVPTIEDWLVIGNTERLLANSSKGA